MTIKEQAFTWLLLVCITGLLITSGIFYNKWQIEQDRDCPAYKVVEKECMNCAELVCVDCYPQEPIVQYTCPPNDIVKMVKQEELIETQNKVIERQQDMIYKLRNYIDNIE